jgi:hypothetical protein
MIVSPLFDLGPSFEVYEDGKRKLRCEPLDPNTL